MKLTVLLLPVIVFSACENLTNAPTAKTGEEFINVPQEGEDLCGAAEAIAKLAADPNYLAELEAKAATGDGSVRVIRGVAPVTLDYNPQRLNIGLSDAGKIESVECF